MAYRKRVAASVYITAAGTFQTWHRDKHDCQIWTTHSTLDEAIAQRDQGRKDRREIVKTPKPIRDIQRALELLKPEQNKPEPDRFTSRVLHHEETFDPYADPPDLPWGRRPRGWGWKF